MIIEKRRVGGLTLFEVEGIIKLGESARFLAESLDRSLRNDEGTVLIDFSGVNAIDSTGLGELVSYLERFRRTNRSLALIRPSERVFRLLEVSGLDEHFPLYESLELALQSESSGTSRPPGVESVEGVDADARASERGTPKLPRDS